MMPAYEIIRINEELKAFAARNFEKPTVCRDLTQIRFYTAELCLKISECESKYNYTPDWAYRLLEEYNRQLDILSERSQTVVSH